MPAQLPPEVKRAEKKAIFREIKTMLFADVVGYTQLREPVIEHFVEHCMRRISELSISSDYAPHTVNTWGDALFAVFDKASHAGCFALQLGDLMEEMHNDWPDASKAPRGPLRFRVGLHTGPVYHYPDWVVRRISYTGTHVSRAARVEPIAKAGQVFATEEFAAMVAIDAVASGGPSDKGRSSAIGARSVADREGSRDAAAHAFSCLYVGTMSLAKKYAGRYRIYRVVPNRRFPIERLAQAAHEVYLESARGRQGYSPFGVAWSVLPDHVKNANREHVADLREKLRWLKWELVPTGGEDPVNIRMDEAQVDYLAQREHERWQRERRRQGWREGSPRCDEKRVHPLLVDWKDLPVTDQEQNRDLVRGMPKVIKRAGFFVKNLQTNAPSVNSESRAL